MAGSINRLFLMLLGFTLTCSTPQAPALRTTGPARVLDPLQMLQRQYYENRSLCVVYHEGDRALMKAACAKIDAFYGEHFSVEWISDMALHPTDLTGKAVLIIGDRRHHLLEMLVEKLPVTLTQNDFRFHGGVYADNSDVLSMWYPNPTDPQMPLMLLVGNRSEAVYPFLFTPLQRPNITLFRKGKIIREGQFDHANDAQWQLGDTGWQSLLDQTQLAVESPRYRIFNYRMAADQDQLNQLIERWNQQWTAAETFLGKSMTITAPIDIYLYKRFSSKARFFADYVEPTRYGNASVRHLNHTYREIHLALEPQLDPFGPAHLVAMLAGANFGRPKTQLLETGLACLLAPNWGGKGSQYWAARQTVAGWAPSLETLLNSPKQTEALGLHYQPFTAAFVAFLQKRWGGPEFAKRYSTWQPTPEFIKAMETKWQTFLKEQAELHLPASEKATRTPSQLPPFPKGANHTFEGFSVDRGYLGVRSDAALTHLAELGANAVAMVPYVRAKKSSPQPLLPLLGVNKENDASIIHATARAKKLGMVVLLKPQLEGPWPGHIDMGSSKNWSAFFQHYRMMMRHYAMMAEIHDLPALCVGVELVQASKHEAFWRELAAELRGLYSGQLVYAANWGEEFERITFWDAFDAIGLDCYYPLSSSANPSDEELRSGANKIIARIDSVGQRFGKPVWLTEVGFASVERAWVEPHSDRGKNADGGEAQLRSYRAFTQALANSQSIQGVWWWKWHSDGRTGPGDTSFSCQDKPAETLLGTWFSKPSVVPK